MTTESPSGASGVPQVLVPYPGPDGESETQDIFLYLRPETNGVLAESVLLRVIEKSPQYRTGINLVYLANVPGEFIVENHIVERQYACKFHFAVHGRRAFTKHMADAFERHFRTSFAKSNVVGSFEALQVMNLTPEELFSTWVQQADIFFVDGQSIKRIDGVFVVNYDLPALLHRNNRGTDIAVMMFRCHVAYTYFEDLVDDMHASLIDGGILTRNVPASRAFHYSKGPFEQLLDGQNFLYSSGATHVPFSDLSFVRYAKTCGFSEQQLKSAIANPIGQFDAGERGIVEENIFTYTSNDSYAAALDKLAALIAQVWMRRY